MFLYTFTFFFPIKFIYLAFLASINVVKTIHWHGTCKLTNSNLHLVPGRFGGCGTYMQRSPPLSVGVHARTYQAEFWERWAMAGRPGAFHKKHGTNIRLYEDGTVAHRVDSYNKAVVFTEQPIPVGASFQVKMLDKGGGWAGSIVSFTWVSCAGSNQGCSIY